MLIIIFCILLLFIGYSGFLFWINSFYKDKIVNLERKIDSLELKLKVYYPLMYRK